MIKKINRVVLGNFDKCSYTRAFFVSTVIASPDVKITLHYVGDIVLLSSNPMSNTAFVWGCWEGVDLIKASRTFIWPSSPEVRVASQKT